MTAKNSGAHLVVELSADVIEQFLHQLLMSKAGLTDACILWPTPSVTFELLTDNGVATLHATKADGNHIDYNIHDKVSLATGVLRGQTIAQVVGELLSPSLPQNVTVSDVVFRVVGQGSALAIGVFFQGALEVSEEDSQRFATSFNNDFLLGRRDFGVAFSVELLDRLLLRRPEIEGLVTNLITPEDPNNFASLSALPPKQLRISGRGEVQTEDCGGVDLDWWVDIQPRFENDLLKVRAEFDYDKDFWDGVQVVLCIAGNVLLGAWLGFLASGFVANIIGAVGSLFGQAAGAILFFPEFGPPSSDTDLTRDLDRNVTVTPCGDQCSDITVRNPFRPDGRFVFALDQRQSIAVDDITVDPWSVVVFGTADLWAKVAQLLIRDVRSYIFPTAQSVCAGGTVAYQPATFTLVNPHSFSSEYEGPQICALELSENLEPHAEIYLEPYQNPAFPFEPPEQFFPDRPFQLRRREQRGEIRIKSGAQPEAITGSLTIRTNSSPTTRQISINVAALGPGTIEVDPPVLEFEQRDQEVVDLRSLGRRQRCEEPGPVVGQIYSVGSSFTIENAGVGTLHVCDITVDNPVLQINHHPSFALTANTEAHVPVVLNQNANVNQQYTGTVTVESTDPDNPQVKVTVIATALTPPQGVNVGGPIVRVDNFINVACLEVSRPPGQEPPSPEVDLERWKEIFTDPPPERPDTLDIYEIALRNPEGQPGLVVSGSEGLAVKADADPTGGDLAVTVPGEQMKTAEIHDLAEGESVHLHVASYVLNPVSKYESPEPVSDLRAAGAIAALAAEDGLRLISLGDVARPETLLHRPDLKLTRLEGNESTLFGLSEEGMELFSVEPEFRERSRLKLEHPLDIALGQRSLVYTLTEQGLGIVDAGDVDSPTVLHQLELEGSLSQLVTLPSVLCVFGAQHLMTFGVARPWLPEPLSTTELPSVESISHWGPQITALGSTGTRMFRVNGEGGLVQVAEYPAGHWADRMIADRSHRHIFSLLPEGQGFTLWQIRRRQARAMPDNTP